MKRDAATIFQCLAQERSERAAYRRNVHFPPETATPWTRDEILLPAEQHDVHRLETLGPPPARHGGVRKTSKSGETNWTGSDYFNGREIQIESGGENKVQKVLKADPNTKALRSQSHRLEYTDANGEKHHHILDYLQTTYAGERIGYAVKTEKNRAMLQRIVDFVLAKGHPEIDDIKVWTEIDVPAWKHHNALDLYWARLNHHKVDVDVVRRRASQYRNTVEFWQLYNKGVHHWGRCAAIFHLIETGELSPVIRDERITPTSVLRINLRC